MLDVRAPIGEILDDELDEPDVQRLWRGIQRRSATPERQPLRWAAAGAGLAFAVAAAVWLLFLRPAPPVLAGALELDEGGVVATAHLAASERRGAVALADGSTIELRPDSRVEVIENSGRVFVTHVARGGGRFYVKPGGPRRWVLECGLATVEVLGTRFDVNRSENSLRVRVEKGTVLVRGERVPDRIRRLGAGEEIVVTREPTSKTVETEAPEPRVPSEAAVGEAAQAEPESERAAPASGPVGAGPPPLGADGDAAEPALIDRTSPHAKLLDRADAERRRGNTKAARALLERVIAEAPGTAYASVAALTLGRLEMSESPEQAAQTLEKGLKGTGAKGLHEDTLARLVEARARAGQLAAARSAAAEYERRYPAGRHLARVKRWASGARSVAALAVVAVALPARAQPVAPPDRVGVELPACAPEPFDFAALIDHLRLELTHDGVRQVERTLTLGGGSPAVLQVSGPCAELPSRARISFMSAGTPKGSRVMDLSDVPKDLAPRALALAAAELLRAVWRGEPVEEAPPTATFEDAGAAGASSGEHGDTAPEAATQEPAPVAPSPAAPRAPAALPARTPPLIDSPPSRQGPSPWLVGLGARGRWFADGGTLLYGAGADLGWRRLRVGVTGLLGTATDRLGDTSLRLAHGSVGYALLQHDVGATRLEGVPRGGLGAAWASGDATVDGAEEESVTVPYVDVAAAIGARTQLSSSWSTAVELEGGFARGVRLEADEREVARIAGWHLGASLGAAFHP